MRLIALLVLCIAVITVQAQDNSDPVLRGYGLLERHQITWSADSRILYISYTDPYGSYTVSRDDLLSDSIDIPAEGDEFELSASAFAYDVQTGAISLLQPSPLLVEMDETRRDFYHSATGLVYRSPYISGSEDQIVPIFYVSDFHTYCGSECVTMIAMAGWHNELWLDASRYRAVDIDIGTPDTGLLWSTGAPYAGVAATQQFSAVRNLFHVNLTNGDGHLIARAARAYAISPDGQRVLYGKEGQLILWRAPIEDEDCGCTYWADSRVIGEGGFIGANFITGDDSHVLAVSYDGIRRYETATGEYEIVDPAVNSAWAELVAFSPDNRYAAAFSAGALYVLPVNPDE